MIAIERGASAIVILVSLAGCSSGDRADAHHHDSATGSGALVTVGAAAFKWSRAWSKIDQDFYQFHMYDWINEYWPYSGTPADYGLADKPVIMGESPVGSLAGVAYGDLITSWWDHGYAGALGWQFSEANAAELADVKSFADQHVCETRY